MHWILQENLYSDENHRDLHHVVAALEHIGASYRLVKLISPLGTFEPEFEPPAGKIVALGSTDMMTAARQRGWKPGIFFNDNFQFEAWRNGFGRENLLNGEAEVRRFAEIDIRREMFIRPCEDLKAFTGLLVTPAEWAAWKQRVLAAGKSSNPAQLTGDTMVVLAEPRPIYREYRFFVVGGRVVSGSLYRTQNGRAVSPYFDDKVTIFAQTMADHWQPAETFALDLAEGDEGLKVLEINCFNGSGFYACNLAEIFGAVERHFD